MYQYIHSLRHKSDHHKRRFALAASGAITAMIFMAWVSVLLPQTANQRVVQVTVTPRQEETPFESLRNSVAQAYIGIQDLFAETTENVDLEEEYNKMKSQVESGSMDFGSDDPRVNR
jgi:hypothetical protein